MTPLAAPRRRPMKANDQRSWKEVNELAHKLARIWAPCKLEGERYALIEGGQFTFVADIAPDVRFSFQNEHNFLNGYPDLSRHVIKLQRLEEEAYYELTGCYETDSMNALWDNRADPMFGNRQYEAQSLSSPEVNWYSSDDCRRPELQQFIADWLPLFRRNCFLSGCPLEATSHEQLEWHLWLQEQTAARYDRVPVLLC